MPYVTTGKRRSLYFTVIKHEETTYIADQQIILNGALAFPGYASLGIDPTAQQTALAQLSVTDFNLRKLAYKSHLESVYASEPLLLASLNWTKCELEAALYVRITGNEFTLTATAFKDAAYTIPELVTQNLNFAYSYYPPGGIVTGLRQAILTIPLGQSSGTKLMDYRAVADDTFYISLSPVVGESHLDYVMKVTGDNVPLQYEINGIFDYSRTHNSGMGV